MSTVMFNERIKIDAETAIVIEVDNGEITLAINSAHHHTALTFPGKGAAENVAGVLIEAVQVLRGFRRS